MADQFTEVTTKGYGSRIMDSIKGVVAGVLLFFASFGLLYWNEGRVNVSDIAKDATEISSEKAADPAVDGKLVSTTGTLTSAETIGDLVGLSFGTITLNNGKYIQVNRNVEMYGWIEESSSSTEKNVGGSETTKTTYNYKKGWTSNPGTDFKIPEGHFNPAMAITSTTNKVSAAKVGVHSLEMSDVDLPGSTKLVLNKDSVVLPTTGGASFMGQDYVYIGSNQTAPAVGDLRVSYTALKADQKVTLFGKLEGGSIVPYIGEKETKLYRVFEGTRDQAVSTLKGEYNMWLWIFRLVGFLMMWFGLTMFMGPISTVLDVLPFLGGLSRSLIGVVMFVVALVLSVVTIVVSMLLHNIVALIIAAVITIGVIFFVLKMMKKKKLAPAPAK